MNLTLIRSSFVKGGIFGRVMNGQVCVAVTLEHSYSNLPKVPNGSYACRRGMHRLQGMAEPFETFEVTGVVGHTKILFHPGNYNDDSAGCILLGDSRQGDMITNSRSAFHRFMALQEGASEFQLDVQVADG